MCRKILQKEIFQLTEKDKATSVFASKSSPANPHKADLDSTGILKSI